MREILFRGKDIKRNEWVYGGYYKHLKRTPSPIGDKIKEADWQSLIIKSGFSDWNMPKPLEFFEVYEDTVGQYTGLKDKNGKKIYEGDIYRISSKDIFYLVEQYENKIIGKQIKRNDYISLYYSKENIEIVGNKYDNPELLQ